MAEDVLTLEEVRRALTERIASVLALQADVPLDARFDEDLHADSLDLVEVVEGVERDLAARGFTVALDDEQLLGLRTVRDAAEQIHASTTPTEPAG
jgi:acyl carrier protein